MVGDSSKDELLVLSSQQCIIRSLTYDVALLLLFFKLGSPVLCTRSLA
jgi:hypothetical protein